MRKKSILFVCSGNVYRSRSAEHLLKKYLARQGIKGWRVDSAGITAKTEDIDPATLAALKKLGVARVTDSQKKLSARILDRYDVVVAMAENHVRFIRENFDRRVVLFNELAVGRRTSIWDIQDKVSNYKTKRKATVKEITATVNNINSKIPQLFQNAAERFYLFSDFVEGRKKHRNGYPFIKLAESPAALAFMSVSIPNKEDGHILVIPKKRHVDFGDIPTATLREVFAMIQKIGRALSRNHGGYNVFLNNGTDAGQYIFHSHFHIIPRTYRDGIRIELWKKKNISVKDFMKLNGRLKKQINS